MTRKFKQAVRGVVADGKVTTEEEKAVFDLGKEESLSPHEVQIFLSTELKKRQNKIEKQNYRRLRRKEKGSWMDNEAVKTTALSGVVYAVKKGAPHALKAGKKAIPYIVRLITRR